MRQSSLTLSTNHLVFSFIKHEQVHEDKDYKYVGHDSIRCPGIRDAVASWYGFYLCLLGSKNKFKTFYLPKYGHISSKESEMKLLVSTVLPFLIEQLETVVLYFFEPLIKNYRPSRDRFLSISSISVHSVIVANPTANPFLDTFYFLEESGHTWTSHCILFHL